MKADNSPSPNIPDHELIRCIGSGGYGEVWLARNSLSTLRAVKIVRRAEFDDDRPYEREFAGIRKFEPISRSHEGFVDLLQVGRNDAEGYFYYVMELADDSSAELGVRNAESTHTGPSAVAKATTDKPDSLSHPMGEGRGEGSVSHYSPRTLAAEVRARGALPLDECLRIARTLTSALAELHRHSLLHRDIKPSNIIFVDGVPKLADIGLVAAANEARSFVGTEGFIPPEGPGTPQADLYSLGIVLYVISTGKSHRDFPEPPADLASRPDRERWLELQAIIHRACQADPRQRYASAEAMLADIELLDRGQSVKRKRAQQRCLKLATRIAVTVVTVGVLGLAALRLVQTIAPWRELRSSNPEVNRLVDQGNLFLLDETPERVRQALESFRKATDLDPSFVPAHYGIYNAQMGLNDIQGMGATATNLMKLAPESAEAHLPFEYLMWLDWHFQEALEGARLTTKRRAFSKMARARSYMAYGFMLVHSGYPEKALEQYRIAVEISGADSHILRHLGHPYFAQREFDQALKHYDESVRLQPNHERGHYWKGRALEELGDFENAINAFETSDLLRGKDAAMTKASHESLREAYWRGGADGYWRKRLDDALAEAKPDLYEIATLYARLEEKEKAYDYLQKACDQNAFTQNLLFDACWDRKDGRFQDIARSIGLLR